VNRLPLRLCVSVFSLLASAGAVDRTDYHKPEGYSVPSIRLRADSGAAFNIPGGTYFGLEDPLLLDNQDIVAKFLVYADEDKVGILRWSSETGLSKHFSPEGSFPSGISYNPESQELHFEQVNYGYFSEGLMALSQDFKLLRRSFFDKKYLFTSSPQSVGVDGTLVVRDQLGDASQALSLVKSSGHVLPAIVSALRDAQSPYSYIFPHLAQRSGLLAVKVRHGRAGEIAESQGDEILLVDLRQSPVKTHRLLADRDLDPSSQFAGFDNTGALDASGNIAWIARLRDGRRALVSKLLHEDARILVSEGEGPIARFSNFHIAMNLRGDIVFRGVDSQGFEGIWRTTRDGQLWRVLRENDRVKTDQGPALLGVPGDFGGVIYMSPQVNSKGDILVGAYLRTDEASPRDIGVGYFVVEPMQ
jgi:hypothetical protein